jgi:hypothetical protein
MSEAERRAHTRYPVKLDVDIGDETKRYRLVADNLSLGGIFLRGDGHELATGDDVHLSILVPGESDEEIKAEVTATAVQVIRGAGVGLRFEWTEATESSREMLKAFITRAGMEDNDLIHDEMVGLATDAEEERD